MCGTFGGKVTGDGGMRGRGTLAGGADSVGRGAVRFLVAWKYEKITVRRVQQTDRQFIR